MKNKFSLLVCFLLAIIAGCTSNSRYLALPEQQSFKFNPEDKVVLIPVTYEGKIYNFMIDTGASWIIFDKKYEGILGKPIKKEKVNVYYGHINLDFFKVEKLSIGNINTDQYEVASMDLEKISNALELSIDGLIGMDFLRNYIIRIDFALGQISFLNKIDINDSFADKLRMKYNTGGIPVINGQVDSIPTEFMIDTGLIPIKFLDYTTFEKVKADLTDSRVGEDCIRVNSLHLGKKKYTDLIFHRAKASALGYDFLSQHSVIFDFKHNYLYLKDSTQLKEKDELNMTGANIVRIPSGNLQVQSVKKYTPAETAGVFPGDIILSIDGLGVINLSRWEIAKLLRKGDGSTVIFKIKRNDNIEIIIIKLSKLI